MCYRYVFLHLVSGLLCYRADNYPEVAYKIECIGGNIFLPCLGRISCAIIQGCQVLGLEVVQGPAITATKYKLGICD